jgi:hypothetical protein
MPKATLRFNLPEESAEFTHAIRGGIYHALLNDIWEAFFRKVDESSDDIHNADNAFDLIVQLFENRNVNPHDEDVI